MNKVKFFGEVSEVIILSKQEGVVARMLCKDVCLRKKEWQCSYPSWCKKVRSAIGT